MSSADHDGATALPVLVFDGDCAFCTSSARWGRRRLGLDHVEPWQRLDLDALGLTRQRCERAVQWVGPAGTVHSAERAIIAALRHAGGAWALAGWALGLPGFVHVAGAVYRLVARNRHRLPGSTPACELPTS